MPEESNTNKLMFFHNDQLVFTVTHPGHQEDEDPKIGQQQISELLQKSLQALNELGYENAQLKIAEVFSFRAVPKQHYDSRLRTERKPGITPHDSTSLLFANIAGVDDDPIEFFDLVTKLEDRLLKGPDIAAGLILESLALNWFLGSAPEGSGTGGPGGWPVAYRGPSELAPYHITSIRLKTRWIDEVILGIRAFLAEIFGSPRPQIQTSQDIITNTDKGRHVNVIMLDTAPTSDTEAAYRDYRDKNPLIYSLLEPDGKLGPNGRLTLHRLPPAIKAKIENLSGVAHDYDMSDHGIHGASSIHTIAPCAKIHLVEVLNSRGMGNTESIIYGFKKAIEIMQTYPDDSCVVSCSFTHKLPLEDGHRIISLSDKANCFADFFTKADADLEDAILAKVRDVQWLKRQRASIQHACDYIYAQNSIVIAAAGNDRKPGQEVPPQARYPAALESVQGVGALPRTPVRLQYTKRKTASYSNVADRPGRIGIATLGGEAGEGQGVLGLYLGELPGGEDNRTKLAWWHGTSSATPIVSGLTAAILSTMGEEAFAVTSSRSRQPAQAAIDRMYSPERYIEESTGESEVDVLDIIQG
jgi:hypothetical protein